MDRSIIKTVTGYRTHDGAGVSLVRVLSNQTTESYDPILLLDSFDSINPDDYKAGFPLHPHRGIETISYVYQGKMVHKDSLGNEGAIGSGEVQWMTAGSGILHEEMLPASKRMLGVQLWLNLPAKDKMVPPEYHSIRNDEIEEIELEHGKLRLLAGTYGTHRGYQGKYLPLDYYDVHLDPGGEVSIKTPEENSVMVFTLVGNAFVAGQLVPEKTAVKLTAGDQVVLKAENTKVQILFISSRKLDEMIAWGGPIVMNTREELEQAFTDLRHGNFLKDKIHY